MSLMIAEQLAAGVYTALYNQIAGVDTFVERAREDTITRDDNSGKAITIHLTGDQVAVGGPVHDDVTQEIEVRIYVRGADWETQANAIAVLAHAKVMAYGGYPASLARVRRSGARWEGDEGDAAAGRLALSYRFRYFGSAVDLTAGP